MSDRPHKRADLDGVDRDELDALADRLDRLSWPSPSEEQRERGLAQFREMLAKRKHDSESAGDS